jgi:hypothetical protein
LLGVRVVPDVEGSALLTGEDFGGRTEAFLREFDAFVVVGLERTDEGTIAILTASRFSEFAEEAERGEDREGEKECEDFDHRGFLRY